MTFPIRFVLCETSHPGNIGAAARAIKTMGFSDLTLVNPKEFPSGHADARASGALDVLRKAPVTETLAEAVADCALVIGASARRRSTQWPELNPRECATEVLAAAASQPVAIVFGTERSGLLNEQMDLCNALVCIPANPEYSSLNLGAAVQLIAYELHYAQADFAPVQAPEFPRASSGEMELFYEHLWRVLIASGFLKPDNPRQLPRKLRRLFNRAAVDENEVNILRGVLSSVEPSEPLQADEGADGLERAKAKDNGS
jgi:tRNA (cytidine32/uridine32-2'-O)-methyltransferase